MLAQSNAIKRLTLHLFSSQSEGFKLAVMHHLDMPLMTMSGISIKPGSEVQVNSHMDFNKFVCVTKK
jgi:hypothetical protein